MWLATKAFLLHTLLSGGLAYWALVNAFYWPLAFIGAQWVPALIIWAEWKHSC